MHVVELPDRGTVCWTSRLFFSKWRSTQTKFSCRLSDREKSSSINVVKIDEGYEGFCVGECTWTRQTRVVRLAPGGMRTSRQQQQNPADKSYGRRF